jgi:hypothetical protein
MVDLEIVHGPLNIILYPILFSIMVISGGIVWCWLWKRINCKQIELWLGVSIGILLLLFVSPGYVTRDFIGSTTAISFLNILVAVFTIRVVAYLKLSSIDYIILTVCLFIIQDYCYRSGFFKSMLFLSGWLLLCGMVKRHYGSLKKMAIPSILSFFAEIISYCLYNLLFEYVIKKFYYTYSSMWELIKWQKVIFLSGLAVGFLMLMAGILFLLKKGLQHYFSRMQDFSKKYEEIGQYLLMVPLILGIVLFIMDAFEAMYRNYFTNRNMWIMVFFIVVFVGMQLFYLRLLIKTVHLKEHIEYKEAEQMNLALYNKDILKNMQEIRAIKHDLKNVFLTMGEYVARSNDEQMQEFYYENIAPFARNEIRINDFYVGLQELQNESLGAFLYYKLLQGIELQIDMQLETRLDHTFFPFFANTSDFIRILGIFLDNAIEESVQIQHGFIQIIIREKERQISISIKNSVRKSIKQSGVYAGTTSKGLGRGNGLTIVEHLVQKHDDLLWNSYFQEDVYVQVISAMRKL